ncbi:uncharacterized protein LOC124118559 isoform X3 [Haliotis rufescens]|uniref:uncharacterized protein LOC124118559 isoform X3 n=1 Tax=Haliotis rufescens TaxID=6454 RepID=UPI00201F8CAC|nr:uncharacterized protein LOC124118559 isoform X3 [Haliotis rufescens]
MIVLFFSVPGGVSAQQRCTIPDPNVRLYNDGGPGGLGLLEVKDLATNSWGSVCADNFDVATAKVVCRMVCFDDTYATPMMIQNITLLARFKVMFNPYCHGGETNLLTGCQHSPWGDVAGCTDAVYMTCLEDNPCHPEHCVAEPDAPSISCNDTYMRVEFSKVHDKDLTPADISLMTHGCPIDTYSHDFGSGDQVVSALIALDTCGVKTKGNSTHLFYETKLVHNAVTDSSGITRGGAYVVDATCAFKREHEVNIGVEIVTQSISVIGSGVFHFKMFLWKSDHFFERYTGTVSLHINDCLNVTVDLITNNNDLKVVVPDCWVTPEPDNPPTHSVYLMRNKTAEEKTLVGYPLSHYRFGFKFRVFQFGYINKIRVHCKAIACEWNESSTTCQSRYHYRRKRDTDDNTVSSTVIINPVDSVDNYPVLRGVPAFRKKHKHPGQEKTKLSRGQMGAATAIPPSYLTPTPSLAEAPDTPEGPKGSPNKPVVHAILWKTSDLTSDLGPRPDLHRNQTVHMTLETEPITSEFEQSIHITTCGMHPWNKGKPFVELLRNGLPSENTMTVTRNRDRIALEFKTPLEHQFTFIVISCKVHACFEDRPTLCSEDTEAQTSAILIIDCTYSSPAVYPMLQNTNPLPKSAAEISEDHPTGHLQKSAAPTEISGDHPTSHLRKSAAPTEISEDHPTSHLRKSAAPNEISEKHPTSHLRKSAAPFGDLEDPEPVAEAFQAGDPQLANGHGNRHSGTLLAYTSIILVYGVFV